MTPYSLEYAKYASLFRNLLDICTVIMEIWSFLSLITQIPPSRLKIRNTELHITMLFGRWSINYEGFFRKDDPLSHNGAKNAPLFGIAADNWVHELAKYEGFFREHAPMPAQLTE